MGTFSQALIVGAVLFANIYWQFTPNGYLAAAIGIGLAFGAKGLFDLISKRRADRIRNRQW